MRNRVRAIAAACVLSLALPLGANGAGTTQPNRAPAYAQPGCSVASGTLTMVATDNQSDFSAFALYGPAGQEIARQYIPLYSSDASAELMFTPLGFATTVSSVRCLADSALRRCTSAAWPAFDEGLAVNLSGVLLGRDWAVVAIKAHDVSGGKEIAAPVDGGEAGFRLDAEAVRWSSFYDSQTEASQAYFGLQPGDHELTIGSRDAVSKTFVPQDRLCFDAQ